jgi:hypothetical protein
MKTIVRSRILLSLAAIVALVVAGCASRQPRPPQIRRLPNGAVLKLEATSYGKQHRLKLRDGSWHDWVGGDVAINLTERDTLLFWFSQPRTLSSGAGSLPYRALIADEHGCQFEIQLRGASQSSSSWLGMRWQSPVIDYWIADSFPRRGQTVALRFYTQNANPLPVAEFTAPNPAPGPHPTWAAEPYPITKRAGDLAFTLVGLRGAPAGKLRATGRFRVTRNGRPTDAWEPVEITVSDATGNLVTEPIGRSDRRNDRVSFRALCPYESAWRLRVEFSQTAHSRFPPKQYWTVRGVAVPPRDAIHRTTASATRSGAALELQGIAGAGTVSWTPNSPSMGSRPYARLRVSPGDALRPTLTATDDRRREVIVSSTSYGDGPVDRICDFALHIPSGAKSLDLTFAVHPSRFAEFIVRPPRPGG